MTVLDNAAAVLAVLLAAALIQVAAKGCFRFSLLNQLRPTDVGL